MHQWVWHKNPDEALKQKCRYLEQVRKKDGRATYWNLVRELLKKDPWFLMRVALQWGWLDEDIIGHDFIKHIADNWGEDIAVLLPRGHGKTLPTSGIVISHILNDPNCAILQVNRTDDNAEKFGSTVADILLHNDYLQQCFGRKYNENGFLPSSKSECTYWGKDGYSLPWRKPRLDPTLLCTSAKSAVAGKHPDWVYVDDLTEIANNNPKGWEETVNYVRSLWFVLPPQGFYFWTGTRWHDGDPLGKVERGELKGKQGKFHILKRSCYVDDMPAKGPLYRLKRRWNMEAESGYSMEMLENARAPQDVGGLGEFFDAQMRNDPIPQERSDIQVKDINLYEKEQLPPLGNVEIIGIETTGGGKPIYNGFIEYSDKLKFSLPIQEITNPVSKGLTKKDRIVAELQPIVRDGRLYAKEWMIGDVSAVDNLGYELRRLGKARHDDIADALHNIPKHLVKGVFPAEGDPAPIYIAVDLAWTESQQADFTVCIAVAVDWKKNYWILDYDRFKISTPSAIHERILEFYTKFEEPQTQRNSSRKKFPGAWR